jgi:Tol biopolymer transport system component
VLGFAIAGCTNAPTAPSSAETTGPEPSPVPRSPSPARIALSAYLEDPPSQGFDVYLVNADGSGLVNLTDNPARDMYPDWSPDGDLIAFCSDREGPSQVFVMRRDGTEVRRLTTAIDDCGNPSWSVPIWSPGGAWIAITSAPGGSYPEAALDLFVVRADGSEVINLTDHPAAESGPSWSPDSTRLAFTSDRDGNEEIYVVDVDGSGLTRLTENPARDGAAAWSPDSARIAFVSNRDGNWEIYTVAVDGSGVARLTNDPGSDLNPAWSPDGRQIAFTSDRSGNGEIYRMDPDGGNVVDLTNSPEREAWFAWAPDGERLAASTCTGDCLSADTRWSIWRVPLDGSPRVEILPAAGSFTWEP